MLPPRLPFALLALLASLATPPFASAAPDPAAEARLHAQTLRTDPDNESALRGLGRALLALDRPSDSLRVFRRLLVRHPNDPNLLLDLAAAAARRPDPRRTDILEALDWTTRALDLRPDSADAWHLRSVLLLRNGDYAPAALAARRALECDARSPVSPPATPRYQQQEIACLDALSLFSPLD